MEESVNENKWDSFAHVHFSDKYIVRECGKQDASVGLESIDVPEIEKIEHTGTTGGKDGNYSYSFQMMKLSSL